MTTEKQLTMKCLTRALQEKLTTGEAMGATSIKQPNITEKIRYGGWDWEWVWMAMQHQPFLPDIMVQPSPYTTSLLDYWQQDVPT